MEPKLAAILVADGVGYSLMENAGGALRRL
jgi:hypothetical protein